MRGLSLRITPAGKKSWTLRYRNYDGKQRRLSLGSYPEVGLAAARIAAEVALGEVAGGDDPAQARRESRAAAKARKIVTVPDLIEAYLEDAEKGRHRPNARPKRSGTIQLDRYYFERLVRPQFSKKAVDGLERAEVQRFLDKVSENSASNARHCRNMVRQAYNYAIRREIAEKNPAQFAELPVSMSRERVLDDDELRAIWSAAGAQETLADAAVAPATGLAIRLAMTTLQRGGEVVGIHAGEIDRSAAVWTIPGTRTKNHRTHVVPLSDTALTLLNEASSLKDTGAGSTWRGFAFPSPRSPDRSITRHAFSRAAKRLTAGKGIADATPHDFRRTGASNITGERIGMPRFIVSRVLNQISDTGGAAPVTGIYDRNEYLVDKRRAGRDHPRKKVGRTKALKEVQKAPTNLIDRSAISYHLRQTICFFQTEAPSSVVTVPKEAIPQLVLLHAQVP